jgi:hypothetical protein
MHGVVLQPFFLLSHTGRALVADLALETVYTLIIMITPADI